MNSSNNIYKQTEDFFDDKLFFIRYKIFSKNLDIPDSIFKKLGYLNQDEFAEKALSYLKNLFINVTDNLLSENNPIHSNLVLEHVVQDNEIAKTFEKEERLIITLGENERKLFNQFNIYLTLSAIYSIKKLEGYDILYKVENQLEQYKGLVSDDLLNEVRKHIRIIVNDSTLNNNRIPESMVKHLLAIKEFLIAKKFITNHDFFIPYFEGKSIDNNQRIIWEKSFSSLFYFLFRLNKNAHSFNNIGLSELAYRGFKVKNSKNTKKNFNDSYNSITTRLRDKDYAEKKHPEILFFIDSLN
ncbi:MAG: hypothetical protein ACK4IK_03430 [Bacteroidia bacterium]